ncbi:MAG TPA: DUF2127 domain-containing protein [Methanomassiliicoccales archaeon]|jgi:hypothetical protein
MYQPFQQPVRNRPVGVTILAILQILGGVLELILALGFFLLAALINVTDIRNRIGTSVPDWVINNAPVFFGVLGLLFLIMAIISLVLAWAFLKGKNWARMLAIVFLVLSIIGNAIGIIGGTSLITVAISILFSLFIVWYLFRPNVKQWFTA